MTLSILHILAPAQFGGLESVVRGLSQGQVERGSRVRVIALTVGAGEQHPLVSSLQHAGVEASEWDVGHRAYLEEARRVASICEDWSPAVVHTHGYHADVIAGAAARWSGVPTVTTVHGFLGGGWKNRIYERLQRWSLRRFDAVVAVSESLSRELIAEGVPAERIHTIPNAWTGHVEPVAREEALRTLGLEGDIPVIGWVGRLSPEKGLDVLFDALARLRDRPWRLAVVGQGAATEAYRRRAESLGLYGRIRWCGFVKDAGRYFGAFDVYCLSSRTEGMPVVVLEAIAANVPVVATRVGGVEELLTDGAGWTCPPDDPEKLAACLREALESPDQRRQKLAVARQRLSERFGREHWLSSYERVYQRVSEGPDRGTGAA